MSKSTTIVPVHLKQSPNTSRYYFTVNSWESEELTDFNGDSFQSLIPIGNAGNIPEDAIKSVILPIEWNDLTMAEVVAKVGDTADIDYKTGQLFLRQQ
jgi:hypothetical protein